MEYVYDERAHGLVHDPVSVIYISVEEPQQARRPQADPAAGLLHAAAVCVHRMADYVEDLRRSLERSSA